jgi:two-component system sensor histidine kinase KdpD
VELAETVTESVDRLRRQHEHLDVNVRIAPGAALVRADPIFLDRIMSNLLENAATAVADKKPATIEIDVRRSNSLVAVRVIDHGPGVSPAAREQLFYPFYRMDDRNPRLGSGLGLAICKGFVTLLDGDIWIEDTPGGGATFSFTLPSADRGAD